MHKRTVILTLMLLMTAACSAQAEPVTGAGENLEALAVHPSGDGTRIVILAGRRPMGQDSGAYSEIGLIDTSVEGGAGKFFALPELAGTWSGDFQSSFSATGDIYFAKAVGTDRLRVGRSRGQRFSSTTVQLPEGARAGELQVLSLAPDEQDNIKIALRVAGKGTLLTLLPDFSIKQIRTIPDSDAFQSILKLPTEERYVISTVTGPESFIGKYTNHLTLRGADMSTVLAATDVTGLISDPLASADGNRMALITRVAIPGLVTAHLFRRDLTKIKSLVIVQGRSYPWPADLLLSNSRLVTLHLEDRKCIATIADSHDGRVLARHVLPTPTQTRCVAVAGTLSGTALIVVSTYSAVVDAVSNSKLVTYVLPI